VEGGRERSALRVRRTRPPGADALSAAGRVRLPGDLQPGAAPQRRQPDHAQPQRGDVLLVRRQPPRGRARPFGRRQKTSTSSCRWAARSRPERPTP
jgi:hypothetical protein